MLMTAALAGKADAVRLLLTRGAKVDAIEPYKGQTALMWAAAEGNTAAVDVLLEAGARLDAKSTGGFTPFLFAVRNAHIDTAVTLLKHGANVNELAPDGSSALSMATVNAYYELASVLLDHGADPNLPDPRSVAAAHRGVAAQAGRRWRRRRRQHAAGHAGADRHGHATSSWRASCSNMARIPNVARRLARADVRQGRRHGAQPAEHPARTPSPQLQRRHAVLCRREERRRRADAPARPVQGRPDDHRHAPASRR